MSTRSLPLFAAKIATLNLICAWGMWGQPSGYGQPYRPQFHFSPRINWTNDPNGLVYFEGEYHLFFQFNPFGDQWGHMSWGHAVSPDLVHWQELPVAIAEENGVMIFTGSTVVDERNTSGFCTSGKPCLVAVYTGHTPGNASNKPLQTQNLAYSNSRGRTWTKFAGNPVLDLHMSDFRDPKVFWSRQAKRWTMLVALPDEHKVRFYGSADLKQWKLLSDFGPQGGTGGQWECPELFELPVDGDSKHTRWVLKIGLNPGGLQGGSGEQYFVGDFDGARFVNANPASLTLWTDYGKDCYCALTFNHLPPGQPQTMLGWMSNWQYAGQLPTSPWRGQMTFPRKLALRNTVDSLHLVQLPVDTMDKLHAALLARVTGSPAEVNARINSSLAMDARNRELSDLTSTFSLGNAREVGWRVLASADSFTAVGYDRQRQELFIDRTHSGQNGFSKDFPARIVAPLKLTDPNRLQLRLLIDRSSIEVFAEDGRLAMTSLVFPKPGGRMEVYELGGKTARVSVQIWTLTSIWQSTKR
jgi:sucrose-6-phosphate hydrolase SacC (GH32 family)